MSMTDLYKVFDQTVREITREVNRSILKVPEVEQKTLDATSNEPWGPHGQDMKEIARATRNFHEYQMVMAILWKRLQDTGANWRHVYKSLVLMEFLVANGSDRCIDEMKENMYQISVLQEFQYVEPNGKDQGINVRKKAQTLVALLKDREKIREAREKAAANRNKYGGMSSSAFRSGGAQGFGSSNFDSYSSRGDDGYDSYRSREGGAGRRGSGYDDEPYGRSRDGEGRDRYSRKEGSGGYDDEPRGRRSGGGRGDWDKDNDGYKAHGGKPQDDDDDFDVRGKSRPSNGAPASAADDDDFDDFDPRNARKPAPAPTKAPPAVPGKAAAPAPAPLADLLDFDFSPAPAAAAPAPASADPFAAFSAPAPAAPAASASADLFGGPAAAPPPAAAAFSAFPGPASKPAPASDDFEDDDFGGFAAAPGTSSAKPSAAAASDFGNFASAPSAPAPAAKDPFDPFAAFAAPASTPSSASTTPQKLAGPTSSAASKGPAPSGGVWADAISKGILDLNISAGGEKDLASLGIMADSLGTPGSTLNPTSNIPFHLQAGGMGKAMGTGSGKGIAGASSLSPTLMPTAGTVPPMPGLNAFGVASPPQMGMAAPAGMQFGAPPQAMGMAGYGVASPGAVGMQGFAAFGQPGAFSPAKPGASSSNAFQF